MENKQQWTSLFDRQRGQLGVIQSAGLGNLSGLFGNSGSRGVHSHLTQFEIDGWLLWTPHSDLPAVLLEFMRRIPSTGETANLLGDRMLVDRMSLNLPVDDHELYWRVTGIGKMQLEGVRDGKHS